MTIRERGSAEHYRWGSGSDGWHLLKQADLSVIEERVPAGDSEQRHYHSRARQFFYVLRGTATIELEGVQHVLAPSQGLEIPPGAKHQFINESNETVEFLVISSIPTAGDRFNV
jgi:mannose-6-phosphate isomerase-like protein (cupin superfamily)